MVSSSGKRGPVLSSVGMYSVTTKCPLPRTKPPTCMTGVPSGALSLHGHWMEPRRSSLSNETPAKVGVSARDLVHDLGRMRIVHRVAHGVGDRQGDLPVLHAGARRHHLAHRLDAPLGVGEGAVLLEERRAGQEDVGVVRRLVEEEILDDDALHGRQTRGDVMGVGVGLEDVLALDVDALERAIDGGVEHVGDAQPGLACRAACPTAPRTWRGLRPPRCGGSRAVRAGTSPCRRSPARCSGRAAGSRRRPAGRYCRSPWRGWRCAMTAVEPWLCSVTPRP